MKERLKPCPFCGEIPIYFDGEDYRILHTEYCYFKEHGMWIFKRNVKAWENRA